MLDSITELAEEARLLSEANTRYTQVDGYQASYIADCQRMHHWYSPFGQDQWPEDAASRPGKIHYTGNIIKRAVDIDARLQAKLPRVSLIASDTSDEERARAEFCEKLMLANLDATGWEEWLQLLCRTKALYRTGVLKVFWNKDEKRPDVIVVEQPYNLRIGWGDSDFREMDWALYEYSVSPEKAERLWGVTVEVAGDGVTLKLMRGGDHADPLDQKGALGSNRPTLQNRVALNEQPSDYEKKQVLVWDYWYKRDGDVYNCLILDKGEIVDGPHRHRELFDIPYIVIPNDIVPGSPHGTSTAEPLLDSQYEMNRAFSHWQQLVADEIDPSWQLAGKEVRGLPDGFVPKGGQIIEVGDGLIRAIEKPVNTFPVEQLIRALWDQVHLISGLPPISWGMPSGSQVSGEALTVQVDATQNVLDPKRMALYGGLKQLLVFWTVMYERLDPKIADPETEGAKVGVAKLVKGFRRWKMVAPEITPKDVTAHTNNELNKYNAHVQSARTTMHGLGIDSPEDELAMIAKELSNVQLNPGHTQAMAAVMAAIQQLQLQAQFNEGSPGVPLSAAQDQTGVNRERAQQQQAQPTLTTDQNQQPATGPGGVPPASVDQTTLVRSSGTQESSALNQIALNRQLGG